MIIYSKSYWSNAQNRRAFLLTPCNCSVSIRVSKGFASSPLIRKGHFLSSGIHDYNVKINGFNKYYSIWQQKFLVKNGQSWKKKNSSSLRFQSFRDGPQGWEPQLLKSKTSCPSVPALTRCQIEVFWRTGLFVSLPQKSNNKSLNSLWPFLLRYFRTSP